MFGGCDKAMRHSIKIQNTALLRGPWVCFGTMHVARLTRGNTSKGCIFPPVVKVQRLFRGAAISDTPRKFPEAASPPPLSYACLVHHIRDGRARHRKSSPFWTAPGTPKKVRKQRRQSLGLNCQAPCAGSDAWPVGLCFASK